jgi:hypothetical protein
MCIKKVGLSRQRKQLRSVETGQQGAWQIEKCVDQWCGLSTKFGRVFRNGGVETRKK